MTLRISGTLATFALTGVGTTVGLVVADQVTDGITGSQVDMAFWTGVVVATVITVVRAVRREADEKDPSTRPTAD